MLKVTALQKTLPSPNGSSACVQPTAMQHANTNCGKLMLVDGALERDRIQSVAGLDLASKTYPGATLIAADAKAELNPTQIQLTENLKRQLIRVE